MHFEGRKIKEMKVVEIVLSAVAALIIAAKAVIKFIKYLSKLRKKSFA
jgi:hypothetical protein